MLRLWPTDKQILQTIRHSYTLARELAEFLQMLQPAGLPVEINEPRIIISTHYNEVSATIITEDEADENNDLDFSVALNKASVIMKNITTKMHDKENHYNQIFNEGQSQLEIIGEQLDNLSIINEGDSGKYL